MNHLRSVFFTLFVFAVMAALTAGSLSAGEKININTASAKELVQLDRIGPALAERIIRYREKEGAFEKPGDITRVKGIGARTFKGFSDRITVGEPEKKAKEVKAAEKKDSVRKAADRKMVSDAEKAEKKVEEVRTAEPPEKKDSAEKTASEKTGSADKKSSGE